jgi:hypothetical protein
MTGTTAVELYYDPYDIEIDDDPYPVIFQPVRCG